MRTEHCVSRQCLTNALHDDTNILLFLAELFPLIEGLQNPQLPSAAASD